MNLSVAVFSLISYDAVYSTLKIQFLMRCHDAAIEPHMCPKVNSRMEFQIGHQFSILNYCCRLSTINSYDFEDNYDFSGYCRQEIMDKNLRDLLGLGFCFVK